MITGQLAAKKDTALRLNIELYRKLYLIRNAEQKIREHYPENEMKTPVHLSIGKEAIEVGVCHALESRDRIFGTYRSHGIYLARTGETDAFFAELYGRRTGLVRGKVGSMHLCAPEHGLMVTSLECPPSSRYKGTWRSTALRFHHAISRADLARALP